MTTDPKDGVSLLALCAAEPETDIGNSRRFRLRHEHEVLYQTNIGWHGYDGRRWKEDVDGAVVRPLAHRTVEAIRLETHEILLDEASLLLVEAGDDAEAHLDKGGDLTAPQRARLRAAIDERDRIVKALDDRRAARARHAKSSAGSSKIDNMLKEAAPYLSRAVEDMNPDDHALNCLNGTLRFVPVEDPESDPDDPRVVYSARLDPHRRDDWITKLVDVDVPASGGLAGPGDALWPAAHFAALAEALSPRFHEFLLTVQPMPDMRRYLQRLCGYMLTGLDSEQMIAFFYGIGANGKSTFTDLIGRILGDYAVTLSIDSFTGENQKGGGDATPDLVRLSHARSCFASEGDESAKLKEGLIKLLTGSDKIPVRKLHKDFIEIRIKATTVITGNHKPIIRGVDDGIWRRVHLVDWPVQIPVNERDKKLPEKLWAERQGVLAWMIAGALEFLSLQGLHPPASLIAAVQEHREESDPIGAFVRGACEVTGNEHDRVTPGELFDAYTVFCRKEGQFAFPQATFTRRLPEQTRRTWKAPDGRVTQFAKVKVGNTLYRGIRIKDTYRGIGGSPPPDDRPFAPRDEQ
jgi:putative DNA primase/helicase